MVMVYLNGGMEESITGNGKMVNSMVKDSWLIKKVKS